MNSSSRLRVFWLNGLRGEGSHSSRQASRVLGKARLWLLWRVLSGMFQNTWLNVGILSAADLGFWDSGEISSHQENSSSKALAREMIQDENLH